MHGYCTYVLVAQWGYIFRFGVLRGALVLCQTFGVCVGVDVLVDLPSEVVQGQLPEYPP